MNKEEYIKLRDQTISGQLSFEILWNFWKDTKPSNYKDLDLNEFIPTFQEFVQRYQGMPFPIANGEVRVINLQATQQRIYEYYDDKFKETPKEE